jgi:glycerophosphoryl diester phosphodiesterase
MRIAALLLPAVFVLGCGTSSSSPETTPADASPGIDAGQDATAADAHDAQPDASPAADATPEASGSDAASEDSPALDSGFDGDGGTLPDGATWRTSLSVCWNDADCPRVMALAHGGAWNALSVPYDSNAAIEAAYAGDLDGVKIDVRVTKDNVPVIAHSSPIETFESLNCSGKKIEEMTAAQVTACLRVPSLTEHFQRLDDVLDYLRGKMVVQLCVKLSTDYERTIEEVQAKDATDFAFIELNNSGDLGTVIPTLPNGTAVYYLVNLASDLTQVGPLLALKNPRAFMFEIDPGVPMGDLVTTTLHPAGVRAFVYDSAATASQQELQALFEQGFDVVSAQTALNAVAARKAINTSRGVSPP